MLNIVIANQFKKDLRLAMKRGLHIEKLREVVNTLACREPLDEKYRDHGVNYPPPACAEVGAS